MDVTKMTLEELREVVNNFSLANAELRKREQQAEVAERKELREGAAFKKLAAKYKKAKERVAACYGEQEITITLPIKFTVTTSDDLCTDGDCCEYEFNEVFNRHVEGKILNDADVSKKQRVLLQEGVNNVVAQACDTIYGLFPNIEKEQNAALAEFNKVMCEACELDLCHADFE